MTDYPLSERSVSWDRTVCPLTWPGYTRQVDDESVFCCGACETPRWCAEKDRCARELDVKRAELPKRIALCPDCAPEFYYPLKADESLTCPACPLEMVVYERKGPSRD